MEIHNLNNSKLFACYSYCLMSVVMRPEQWPKKKSLGKKVKTILSNVCQRQPGSGHGADSWKHSLRTNKNNLES